MADMSATTTQTQPQQPIVAYPNTVINIPPPAASSSSSSHSNGSFGTVFIVLAVIVVISAIACFLGRLCNRRFNKQKPSSSKLQTHHHHNNNNNGRREKEKGRERDSEFGPPKQNLNHSFRTREKERDLEFELPPKQNLNHTFRPRERERDIEFGFGKGIPAAKAGFRVPENGGDIRFEVPKHGGGDYGEPKNPGH